MDLAQRIYDYYLSHRADLGDEKSFHFATRMAAWRGEPEAFTMLRDLRPLITSPDKSLGDTLREIIMSPQSGKRNAHELRQPFFEKYPLLYGAHSALFRVRHLEAVYGIDARPALFTNIPETTLLQLSNELLGDDEALRVLSTFAVNYIYLLTRVVERNEQGIDIDHFLQVATGYQRDDKTHIQLLIYLYTHCIIGESNFYTRTLPTSSMVTYTSMLQELEPIIEHYFDSINLDNKLEFLVCARICDYNSRLADRINTEAEQSISPDGTFIIDIHNNNIQQDRNDFVKSEHRNVLYIMSTSPYTPHSTLIV